MSELVCGLTKTIDDIFNDGAFKATLSEMERRAIPQVKDGSHASSESSKITHGGVRVMGSALLHGWS